MHCIDIILAGSRQSASLFAVALWIQSLQGLRVAHTAGQMDGAHHRLRIPRGRDEVGKVEVLQGPKATGRAGGHLSQASPGALRTTGTTSRRFEGMTKCWHEGDHPVLPSAPWWPLCRHQALELQNLGLFVSGWCKRAW